MDFEVSSVAPCLSEFSRNIELRVNAGVRNVTACIEKAENKNRMLRHVQDTVLHVTGRVPSAPRSHPFGRPLENVILLKEHRSPTTRTSRHEDGLSNETGSAPWLEFDRTSESSSSDSFLRLIGCECGLDSSKQYVTILAQLQVLCQPKSSGQGDSKRMSMQLHIRFDNAVSTVWELSTAEGLEDGDTFWFAARSPVMTLAMVPSFGDLRLSIMAAADDGRLQHIGAFTMSNILSCITDLDRALKSASRNPFPFLRRVNLIAEGRGAQGLRRMTNKAESAIPKTTFVQIREDLALFSVTVGSATDIAMSVAQLKTITDDDTDIRSTMQITPSSLSWLDDLLLSLEAERNTTRVLATRQDAFGYTLEDIRQILEMQLVADENLGAMEESHLGSWG